MPLFSCSFCLAKRKLITAQGEQLACKLGLHPKKAKVSPAQYPALCTVSYSIRQSRLRPLSTPQHKMGTAGVQDQMPSNILSSSYLKS